MNYRCAGRCGAGLIRMTNQDNLYVNGWMRRDIGDRALVSVEEENAEGIYAVCDGMGGEAWGEEASYLAVKGLSGMSPEAFSSQAKSYLWNVNDQICRLMTERGQVRIGTTFAAFSVFQDCGFFVNIGDSSGFLFEKGTLRKMTRDHTQVQQMMDMGLITKLEARVHPKRHILTQHLGIRKEEMTVEPYVGEHFLVKPGMVVLLCSDGLTDMVSEEEISVCLGRSIPLAAKADLLYRQAMTAGGRDNITIVLVEAEDDMGS